MTPGRRSNIDLILTIARSITRLNRWVGSILSWLIIPFFLLLILDVMMRYIIGRPLVWTSELAQLLFGVYAILGGGFLLAERGHVSVDIVYSRLSRRRKALVDIATSVLFFTFIGILLWQGWSLALDSMMRLERSNSAWSPPIWPVKLVAPLASLLLLLQGLVQLAGDILVLLGLPVSPDVFGRQPSPPTDNSASGDLA